MLAALRLLQLLRSPSCLAGCSRSSRKAALTRSGLPSRPQRRMLRVSAWRSCWTKRGEVESAKDAFGARGLASPGPLLDAFSCTFCGLLVSVWFLVPAVYVVIQAHCGCLRGVVCLRSCRVHGDRGSFVLVAAGQRRAS